MGTDVTRDLRRVRRVSELSGAGISVMVDANGGYRRGAARRVGERLDELGVTWFEEPVSSDDLVGLGRLSTALRCDVTAGEYLSEPHQAAAMSGAVDCLQLDVTRCGGYTGWLLCAAAARAAQVEISAHCAPSLHSVLGGAAPHLRHLEWFIDHARLEPELVDGAPAVVDGMLGPPTGSGHGMTISGRAEPHRIG